MNKVILMLALIILLSGCGLTSHKVVPYISTNIGYKLQDAVYYTQPKSTIEKNVSAHLEIGVEYGPWKAGAYHDSQPFDSWPFNNESEYFVSGFFVGYTKRFKCLFSFVNKVSEMTRLYF